MMLTLGIDINHTLYHIKIEILHCLAVIYQNSQFPHNNPQTEIDTQIKKFQDLFKKFALSLLIREAIDNI